MCGRYVSEEDKSIDLAALYRAVRLSHPDVTLKTGEIFPTDTVPLLTGTKLTPTPASWGFRSYDGKSVIINARAETAAEKPTFAEPVRAGRCIVPATGYFEWNAGKEKYRFSPMDGQLLYVGGLWRMTLKGLAFVILTTDSSRIREAAAVHPRMPLLIPALSVDDWMRDTSFALRYLTAPAVGAVPLSVERIG